MAKNTIVIGKPSFGKTTKFEVAKVCTEQLKELYTVEEIKEVKIKTIGFFKK